MHVRSLRMLSRWSREDLARRSGVSIASVYLIERLGTAGPEDDALIARVLLADRLANEPWPTEQADGEIAHR